MLRSIGRCSVEKIIRVGTTKNLHYLHKNGSANLPATRVGACRHRGYFIHRGRMIIYSKNGGVHGSRACSSGSSGGGGRGRKGVFYNLSAEQDADNTRLAYYMGALAVLVFGAAYASVPLYKVFCQMTGFGGTTQRVDDDESLLARVKPVEGGRIVRVDFTSNVHSAMPWSFKPTQRNVKVVPGETALAFYTVRNPSKRAMTGVATYNVFPPKAGLYFNKIQCFCFEEQRLEAGEEIDMPVFFFIDPEFESDPAMRNVSSIVLSYTFFKTGEEDVVEGKGVGSISTEAIAKNQGQSVEPKAALN